MMNFQSVVNDMKQIHAKPGTDLGELRKQIQSVADAVGQIGDFLDKKLYDHLQRTDKERYEGRSS